MNERNIKTNAHEGPNMTRAEQNKYRQAFWIAVTAVIVLAVVVSFLWWRLSHAGGMSQGTGTAASESMQGMAQTSSTGASDSEPGSGSEMQMKMQETPLAPIQLTPQRMQSIGIVLGKVESNSVSSDL